MDFREPPSIPHVQTAGKGPGRISDLKIGKYLD
jgi:hypothetical protein